MTTGAQLLSQPEDRANAIYTEALFRMFGLVALGVMVTAVSIWVGDALVVGRIIFGNGWVWLPSVSRGCLRDADRVQCRRQ